MYGLTAEINELAAENCRNFKTTESKKLCHKTSCQPLSWTKSTKPTRADLYRYQIYPSGIQTTFNYMDLLDRLHSGGLYMLKEFQLNAMQCTTCQIWKNNINEGISSLELTLSWARPSHNLQMACIKNWWRWFIIFYNLGIILLSLRSGPSRFGLVLLVPRSLYLVLCLGTPLCRLFLVLKLSSLERNTCLNTT